MTNSYRTSDDIERDIVDERAQMSDTISDLQKKFSVDAIVTDLGDMFRNQGGDLSRAVSETVGRNPAAVVLVGVGLAWLVLGQNRRSAPPHAERSHGKRKHRAASWSRDSRATERPARGDDNFWYGDGQSARDAATQDWDDAQNGVGQAVSDLTERLSAGLEDLTEEAKARVLQARHAAYEARLGSVEAVARGTQAATGFFENQPLIAGALAVALGAAIGSALPHSQVEDDTMGDSSDHLFADAQALFRFERDKAMAAARMAASDAKAEIKDIGTDLAGLMPDGKTVGDVIVERAAGAASRVFDRATGDVQHQKSDSSQG